MSVSAFCRRMVQGAAWDAWWLRLVPPHALAMTRIALGLFLLLYAGLSVPFLEILFSSQGLSLPLYLGSAPAWMHIVLRPPPFLVAAFLYGVLLLCLVGMTAGAFFRVCTAVSIVLGLYFWQLQLHVFPTSYNRILLFCLVVLLCSGADRTFSVRMWMQKGSFYAWEPICILPQRLLALQITFTFLGVGWQKLWLPLWQGGEILAYSFISRWATPLAFAFARLPLTVEMYDVMVWGVKIFEVVLPFGFWIPRLRWVSVIGVSLFLLGITFMLSIWWFIFIIPSCVLFWEPERIYVVWKKGWGSEG